MSIGSLSRAGTPAARERASKAGFAAAKKRRERGRSPISTLSEQGHSDEQARVLREAERYRQSHHLSFMKACDYFAMFRELGWLDEAAVSRGTDG